MKISAIIPTINEEETIGKVINGLMGVGDIEVIVVDTNSTDNTIKIAEEMGAKVILQPERGYGKAYKTGMEEATGDVIICLDGDGTYPPEIAEPLVKMLELNNVDFISCDRMAMRTKENYTTLHHIGNILLNKTISLLFGLKVADSQSGMWVFRSALYRSMGELSDGMSFSQELKIEAAKNGRFLEIPIKYGVRVTKPKLNTWRDGFNNLFSLFVKRVEK